MIMIIVRKNKNHGVKNRGQINAELAKENIYKI